MANYRTFHSQLSSIMETLTRAAVAEICELVDDGYAVLHLEISRHQKENEDLRQKLQLIESIIARGAVTDKTVSGRESRLMREATRGKSVMVVEESCSGSRGFEESHPIAVEIKQEQPEAGETGDDERDGVDMLSHDSLGEGEEVEEIATEHEEDNGSGSSSSNTHTHTHTHTLFHPDPADETHTQHSLSLSQHTQRSLLSDTHTPGDSELGQAILLESDDENPDLTLDSIHTDSDTHTHSDAFSDTAQGPTDTGGPHAHTHGDALALDTHGDADTADTHAVGFMERVCVKPEGGLGVGSGVGVTMGVTELLSEWRTRGSVHTHGHHHHAAALSHLHTHGFPHSLTGGLRSGSPSSSSLFSAGVGVGVGLLSHTLRSHGHGHALAQHGHKRSFICAFCGKSFTTSQSLDTHTRIHTGERPFRCGQCGKRFTQSGHLTAHQTVHTGERPHPCAYCSKRFAGKQYLRIHMRKHHPDQQQQG